jgi:putative transposase
MTDIFHALSRGVDKRKIFLDKQDYFRFIHNLFELNNQEVVGTTYRFFKKSYDIASRIDRKSREPRKLLVDILAFCLMPNHYHLLLIPRIEKGISRFMKKLNMAYAKYFNIRYKRKGTLFEGRYKSVLVETEAHFIHLPYYIHLNPLDLKVPEWRNSEIKDYQEALKFLESYRWSSYLDYIGKKNFPSVTNRELLTEFYGGYDDYQNSIKRWLEERSVEGVKDIILE